jgi:hypothetical protein
MAVPDELMVFGLPLVRINDASGNMAHATIGAPALRRQSLQWQTEAVIGSPVS